MSILTETSLGLGRGHKGSQPERVTEGRITSEKTLTYQVKEHGHQDPKVTLTWIRSLEYPSTLSPTSIQNGDLPSAGTGHKGSGTKKKC